MGGTNKLHRAEPSKEGITHKIHFLHLLATTHQRKDEPAAIRRALILAAPVSWFQTPANRDRWPYFVNTYRDLASHFDITLAAIHLPEPEGVAAE